VPTAPLILSVWPGLARLWLRGQWTSLASAIGFGCLLQLALVLTFVWPQLLSQDFPPLAVPTAAWLLVVGFWIGGFRSSIALRRQIAREANGDPLAVEPLLRQVQVEYLKGHWIEAETLLRQLLGQRPADVEAQLLLATLYRRTQRHDEARKQLDALTRLPAAGRWIEEIDRELKRLAQKSESKPQVLRAA
jgi:thioredoxin-like negative regulator of GroEL